MKKLLALSFAVVLACGMLAGCGSTAEDATVETEAQTTAQ